MVRNSCAMRTTVRSVPCVQVTSLSVASTGSCAAPPLGSGKLRTTVAVVAAVRASLRGSVTPLRIRVNWPSRKS